MNKTTAIESISSRAAKECPAVAVGDITWECIAETCEDIARSECDEFLRVHLIDFAKLVRHRMSDTRPFTPAEEAFLSDGVIGKSLVKACYLTDLIKCEIERTHSVSPTEDDRLCYGCRITGCIYNLILNRPVRRMPGGVRGRGLAAPSCSINKSHEATPGRRFFDRKQIGRKRFV